MFNSLTNYIRIEQLAKILTLFIFLLCAIMIWLLLRNLDNQPVEIKDYKTVSTSSLEKFELYQRKLDDSSYLLISKNSEILFAFDCDSLTHSLCDNEFIRTGNKVTIDQANVVSIKGYKYIQLLQVQDSIDDKEIDYSVSYEQLGLNYQQSKGTAFTIFVIMIITLASFLATGYSVLEEKIINKLSILYK